jgi:hypothetical protein
LVRGWASIIIKGRSRDGLGRAARGVPRRGARPRLTLARATVFEPNKATVGRRSALRDRRQRPAGPFDCTPPSGQAPLCRGHFGAVFDHSASPSADGLAAYLAYWDAGAVIVDISSPPSSAWSGAHPTGGQ